MRRIYPLRVVAAAVVLVGVAACGADQPAATVEAPQEAAAPEAVAAVGGAGAANDTIVATDNGNLTITPIHHATLMLNWNGMNILVDPAPQPGAEVADPVAEFTAMVAPDLILVTDIHGDHLNADILAAVSGNATIVAPQAVVDQLPDEVSARTQVIANGETATIAGIQIEAIPMYNLTEDRLQFHDKGRGNGYVVTLGGVRIYIAGDTEDIPEMRALQDIDVAFVPMNLPYTMTPEQAADAVREFAPTIVYPYHYGMSDVNVFAQIVGDASEVRQLNWY